MIELFQYKIQTVTVRDDQYLFDVDDWYDCNYDEYVRDGSVYKKVYKQVTMNVPYYFNVDLNQYMKGSDHLQQVIPDDRVRWLANMVTYYRHTLSSWNKCWGKKGDDYRSGWFGDYDEEKAKVNERQKRNIIRLHIDFMIENGITIDHLKQLSNTDDKTIEYAISKFQRKRRLNDKAPDRLSSASLCAAKEGLNGLLFCGNQK